MISPKSPESYQLQVDVFAAREAKAQTDGSLSKLGSDILAAKAKKAKTAHAFAQLQNEGKKAEAAAKAKKAEEEAAKAKQDEAEEAEIESTISGKWEECDERLFLPRFQFY